jgi:hypothetical protein
MIVDHIEAAALVGGTANDADPRFRSIVFSANADVEGECGRQFTTAVRAEYPRSFGTDRVFLTETPVRSISEVKVDTERLFGADSILDPANYSFDPDSGELIRTDGGRFPEGTRFVKVTYEGGYDARNQTQPPTSLEMPEDLKDLVVRRIAARWNRGTGEAMKSESIGSYSYTRADGVDDDDARVIRKYRR